MRKNILIIGGTRFFGKLLAQRLLDANHRVTLATRGLTPDRFGDRVERIQVDRRDETAMRRAFRGVGDYDLVYDQMCYSPLDAAISVQVFAGKVGRYVMSSSIEAYRHLQGVVQHPFSETDLDLGALPIELDRPWHAPEHAEQLYGLGKRQAEAHFHQSGRLPVVSVRIAHVLAGPQDFTGRLAAYVNLVASGQVLRHSARLCASSFTNAEAISDFLVWVGGQTFLGPVNSACQGELNALDIYRRASILMQKEMATVPIFGQQEATSLSPFDYPFPYTMNANKAKAFGYRHTQDEDWLDDLIRQHVAASE